MWLIFRSKNLTSEEKLPRAVTDSVGDSAKRSLILAPLKDKAVSNSTAESL